MEADRSFAGDPEPSAIALWNPAGLALWSLLFTPAFGAYLQIYNARVLGDRAGEVSARNWFRGTWCVLLLNAVVGAIAFRLGESQSVLAWVNIPLFLAWYGQSARPHAAVVQAKVGDQYLRNPWDNVLLLAIGCATAYLAASELFSRLFAALT